MKDMNDASVLPMRDGRYFALVLFCYGPKDRDWLASVWRDEGGPWHFDYRFRYYATREKGDAFDPKNQMFRANLEAAETEKKKMK